MSERSEKLQILCALLAGRNGSLNKDGYKIQLIDWADEFYAKFCERWPEEQPETEIPYWGSTPECISSLISEEDKAESARYRYQMRKDAMPQVKPEDPEHIHEDPYVECKACVAENPKIFARLKSQREVSPAVDHKELEKLIREQLRYVFYRGMLLDKSASANENDSYEDKAVSEAAAEVLRITGNKEN